MIKIKSLSIKGIRGIKEGLFLIPDSKSVLLFGDNGSGKSSITDSIEWIYKDSVKHLSSEEIDRKGGVTALRNIFIEDMEKSYVNICFNNDTLNSEKSIASNLEAEISNDNDIDTFKEYLEISKNENLILRYRDLTEFVLFTKKEKLDYLSKIIGFTEISNIRAVLKKGLNDIQRSLKARNYDNEINIRYGQIMEELHERVTSDEQYLNKINEIIKPLKMDIVLEKIEDLNKLLSLFKTSDDSIIIEKRAYYNDVIGNISHLRSAIGNLLNSYRSYYQAFFRIVQDVEILNKLVLDKLWEEGLNVLQRNVIDKDECPLCFQYKSRKDLIEELQSRVEALESVKKQKHQFEDEKKNTQDILDIISGIISGIKSNQYFKLEENKGIHDFLEYVEEYILILNKELQIDILKKQQLKTPEEITFDNNRLEEVSDFCKKQTEFLATKIKGNLLLEIQGKITLSRQAYLEIKNLKKEQAVLEKQQKSMNLIYNAFVQKQKEELSKFITSYSGEINDYYQYMHPGERVDNIEIKTIEKEDELTGITIEFIFFNQNTSPPQKYLSESHLNSLGIAFFLASVKAFNKQNRFFILDDIMSSFDLNHRKRLSDLLLEKFSDYQIFILTHERNWFEYMKNRVKGNMNWMINALKWNELKGTHTDETLVDLKQIIEKRIADNENPGLGNLIRQYLERLLKEVCEELQIYVEYRSNELNEKRMSNELLTALKSKINKQPSKPVLEPPLMKILSSVFVANEGSHDSTFEPTIGDNKAFWQDVLDFEKLFYCFKCNKFLSMKYYNTHENKIRCKCDDQLAYDWST